MMTNHLEDVQNLTDDERQLLKIWHQAQSLPEYMRKQLTAWLTLDGLTFHSAIDTMMVYSEYLDELRGKELIDGSTDF